MKISDVRPRRHQNVEEVVRRRSYCHVAGKLPRERAQDQWGVEVTAVIRHHNERSGQIRQPFGPEHRDRGQPPYQRLQQPPLCHEPRAGVQRRAIATRGHPISLSSIRASGVQTLDVGRLSESRFAVHVEAPRIITL